MEGEGVNLNLLSNLDYFIFRVYVSFYPLSFSRIDTGSREGWPANSAHAQAEQLAPHSPAMPAAR